MKKLKIYVLALFFFSFLKINAGTAIKFYLQKTTDKGMAISSVSPNFNSPDIYRFLPSDSLMMTVRASGHGSGMIDQLYFNDVLVFNGPALSSYKFIGYSLCLNLY